MLLITNAQSEPIRIIHNGKSVIIEGGCSNFISDIKKGVITIEHFNFLNDSNEKINRMIGAIAKSSILVVDSTFSFTEINENALAIIKNGTYEYPTGDFGYLYFDVFTENCRCSLNNCKLINPKEVLRMQRLIRIGEGYDFPPFSIIGALFKYNKIKKMCSQEKVFDFLMQKHYYNQTNTQN